MSGSGTTATPTNMLNNSHIIKGRWKIMKKIGQGAFGAHMNYSNTNY